MSFESSFIKHAKMEDKTVLELQYKANKHIRKLIKHDKDPVKGLAAGGAVGAGVGAGQVMRGKFGKLKAVGSALAGAGAGGIAGYGKRTYHSSKAKKYFGELINRGYYPQTMNPQTGHVAWRPPRAKAR